MRKGLFILVPLSAFSLHAATPPHGDDRLRELVVPPQMNLTFHFGFSFQGYKYVMDNNTDLPDEIARLREAVQQRPDEVQQLLQLGSLLDKNGETNASRICYQKAEQLCRSRTAVRPQDGLVLTELGAALRELGKDEEAEHVYRQAVLVSSNEWRCWVGLGNFLANESCASMFPKELRDQIGPSPQPPPRAVLDYRPSPEALKKAEASSVEASRCFDRAMALAPEEPQVYFQRACYMSVSNWESCFFRRDRDNEELNATNLVLSFFSKQTIANLQKAAELSPRNYEYISLAAYWEWFNAVIQANRPNAVQMTPEMLPDKTRRSVLGAMTRLENLSENSDQKSAAGALDNLGVLNMAFGNSQAAAANFRRAVSLDPTVGESWDLLLGALLDSSASPDQLVTVCQSRLKYDSSARNHLLLAKAYDTQKEWPKASEQAEIAEKLETNNVVAPLLLAAIALKQSQNTNYLSVADTDLGHASTLLQIMPESDERVQRWREFAYDGAILCALKGQPEAARNCLREVLKHFPDDETAKNILEAVQ